MYDLEKYNDDLRQLAKLVRNNICLSMLKNPGTSSKLVLALLEKYIRDSFEIVPYLDKKCNRLDEDEKKYLIERYFLYKQTHPLDLDARDDIVAFFEMMTYDCNPELLDFAHQVATKYEINFS